MDIQKAVQDIDAEIASRASDKVGIKMGRGLSRELRKAGHITDPDAALPRAYVVSGAKAGPFSPHSATTPTPRPTSATPSSTTIAR